MFEHVALMATFRVLTQCMMITGIRIRESFFSSLSLSCVCTHHRLLQSILVDLIGKERVDIFTCLSHQLYKKRNNDNYTLLSRDIRKQRREREREKKECMSNVVSSYVRLMNIQHALCSFFVIVFCYFYSFSDNNSKQYFLLNSSIITTTKVVVLVYCRCDTF
jgi:hypothetical protein